MTAWDEEWQALRAGFAGMAQKRFEQMEELMARLAGPAASKEDLETLARHFHSLKGVGASYGYPGITALGKVSQEECKSLVAKGQMPAAGDLKRFKERMEEMKGELRTGGSANAGPVQNTPQT